MGGKSALGRRGIPRGGGEGVEGGVGKYGGGCEKLCWGVG